jgi:hypothetical protein
MQTVETVSTQSAARSSPDAAQLRQWHADTTPPQAHAAVPVSAMAREHVDDVRYGNLVVNHVAERSG